MRKNILRGVRDEMNVFIKALTKKRRLKLYILLFFKTRVRDVLSHCPAPGRAETMNGAPCQTMESATIGL